MKSCPPCQFLNHVFSLPSLLSYSGHPAEAFFSIFHAPPPPLPLETCVWMPVVSENREPRVEKSITHVATAVPPPPVSQLAAV